MSTRSSDSWACVLTSQERSRADEAIAAIASCLRSDVQFGLRVTGARASQAGDPSAFEIDELHRAQAALIDGKCGAALFFAYLALCHGEPSSQSRAEELLEDALATVEATAMAASLYHGFVGPAWAFAHLSGPPFRFHDSATLNEMDEALCEFLSSPDILADVDLMRGIVGIGVYALERMSAPLGRELLGCAIDRIAERLIHDEQGARWLTPPELLPPEARAIHQRGQYAFGLAHGQAGIIGLLSYATHLRISSTAPALLRECLRWVSAARCPEYLSRYPYTLDASGGMRVDGRLGWCNGDLGLTVSFLNAASALNDPLLFDEAVDTGLQSYHRPESKSGVVDASLCHGSAGVRHLFQRIYHMTDRVQFAHASARWTRDVLDRRTISDVAAGFLYADIDVALKHRTYIPLYGFLNGLSGIGLALLAASSDVEPDWDRLLLTWPGHRLKASEPSTQDNKDDAPPSAPFIFPEKPHGNTLQTQSPDARRP